MFFNQLNDTQHVGVHQSACTDNIPVSGWVHCTVIESNQIKAERLKNN